MSVASLPRVGAYPRLVVVIVLFALAAFAADAQTCTLTVNAPPSACTNAPVTASVGPAPNQALWSSISWSIAGGYFETAYGPSATASTAEVFFRPDAGASTITLTTRATDADGCTTADVVTQVPVTDAPLPIISAPEAICPGTPGTASMNPPGTGTWTNVTWYISGGLFRDQNGNPTYNATGETVSFEVTGPDPATLHATTQHSSGCPTPEATAVVNVRSTAAPVINVPQEVCPWAPATASIAPPAEGTWATVSWSITNGEFRDQYGNSATHLYTTGDEPVTFAATSYTDAVTISAFARDSFGCEAPYGTAQVAIRTIPAPVISAPEQVCPWAPATASIAPPAEGTWATVSWSITNGEFRDQYGNSATHLYTTGDEPVTFAATSYTDAVTISAFARDSFGCEAYYGTAQVAIRTIPAPVISAPEQVCPWAPATASIAPPAEGTWASVSWSITNGEFRDQYGNSATYLYTTGDEPVTFAATSYTDAVTISAFARDSFGCEAYYGTAQVAIRTIPAPVISAPEQVCPWAAATASIAPPAEGTWVSVSWSITNGEFRDQYGNASTYLYTTGDEPVTFAATSYTDAVTISAFARDSFGCEAYYGTAQVAIRTIPAPVISAPEQVCPWAPATASIAPPAEGTWVSVSWSITNGEFRDQYGSPSTYLYTTGDGPVTFVATSTSEPVTISAFARDSFGCEASYGTVQVAIRSLAAPVITAPAEVCSNTYATASVEPPATGSWTSVSWSITNGWFVGPDWTQTAQLVTAGEPVQFTADGSGQPITLTASASDDQSCRSEIGTKQVALSQVAPPAIIADTEGLCELVSRPASISGSWTNATWSITGGSVNPTDGLSTSFYINEPTATLTVTAWDASGCSATASRTITAGSVEPPQIQLSSPSVCEGSTATATATNASNYGLLTWSISGPGTLLSSPYGNGAWFSATGDVTLTATPNGSCSTPTSITVPFTANPPASITASDAGPLCPGGEATLTASEGASYLWSTGATTQSIVINAAGTYSVTVSSANGCSRDASIAMDMHSVPPVSIAAGGPTHICEGGTVVLTATEFAGASYLWSNGATTRSIAVSAAGEYNVTVTHSTGCTSTAATPVNVTVEPAPEAVITTSSGLSVICSGNPVRLVATAGGDSYLWSTGETTADILVGDPGSYSVTVTKNGCSTTSAPFAVTAGTPPADPPNPSTGSLTVCPNGTGTVSVTNPEAFARIEWRIDDGTIVGPNDQPSVTFQVNGENTMLYAVGFSETGCPSGMPIFVNVRPPSSDFSVSAMCAGAQATTGISFTEPGTVYQWSITNGTIVSYGHDNASITYTAGGPGTLTISATATAPGGCSTTTTRTAQVSEMEVPVLTAPTTVCTRTGHTASVTEIAGASYTWFITGGVITSSRYAPTVTFDLNSSPVTARLTCYVSRDGCSRQVVADVAYDVTEAVVTASRTSICPGGSVSLSSPAAASWLWSNGATTRFITVTEPGDYFVTTTSATGCQTTSAPVTITADTTAPPAVSLSPSEVCPTQEFVTGTVTNASDYVTINWFTNGAPQGTTFDTATLTIRRATGTHVYWMEAVGTTASGCEIRTRVEIPVIAGPDTTITTSPEATSFCENSRYYIRVPDAGPGATYEWDISNGTIVSGSGTRAVYVQPRYFNGNPLTATCLITDARGCPVYAHQQFPVTPTPQATITAPATMCHGTTQTASVPDNGPNATYQWIMDGGGTIVSGQGTPSITFESAAGAGWVDFRCLVTVNGCVSGDSHSVQNEQYWSQTFIVGGAPTTFCEGGSVTLSAPDVNAQYRWSNGETTRSITVTQSGTYTHELIYPGGCVAPATNPITVSVTPLPPTPEITASGPTDFCEGQNVVLTAPFSYGYLWSSGETTQSITVTQPGSYTVTVTNDYGCTATSAPTIVTTQPGTVNTWTYGPTTFCEGGSVMIVASSEQGTDFLWSNGATTQAITVTEPGSYSVTVTNDQGCISRSQPTEVTVLPVPPTPVVTASGPTTFCHGGNVTLTAPAGYTYAWSNGATTQSIVVEYSGNHQVTVTNAEGCSRSSEWVWVQVHSAPAINWVSYAAVCAGVEASREIYAVPDATSYDWSITNGTITRSEGNKVYFIADGTSPAVVAVTVTNSNGCTSTATQNVTVDSAPTPTVTASGPTTFCSGGSVTLTSSPASSYLWSTGETTQSITVSSSGNYTVTTTAANGCSATSAAVGVTVNDTPEPPAITASGPTTFCTGGSVTLTASAGPSYLWSNGATTQSITVTAAGNYTVTTTDASGCSATSAATGVTVNDNPVATIAASGATTFCSGGSVTLTASPGASYLWSNGATTPAIDVTSSGDYSVTVTNAAGCSTTSAPTTVTVNDNPAATIAASGPTTFCSGGSVTLTASAGASYLWSNGATTQSIDVNVSGNYSVTVTNAAGCSTTSATTAVTVNDNPVATITASGATTFCTGGSVTLTASAGASYLWSNGATTRSIDVNASGNYSVTVTNAAGCSTMSAATSVTVNENPVATITAAGATTFCAGGTVTLTASAGASYLWSTGATTQSITVAASGNYSVTVTNAAGCSTTSAPTAVTVNDNPVATITADGPTSFCTGGAVTLTASPGTSYLWSNGATTQSITVSASGNYSVTVSNAAGCSTTSAATEVSVNDNPAATITASGPTTFCSGGSVTLTASAGTSYAWSNGATTQSVTVSDSGNYSVTVTNAAGCSTTSGATAVTVNDNPVATITADGPTSFCSGGAVTLTASPGTSYLWSNGATTQSITVSASGDYSVTVSNAAGCSTTSAATEVSVNDNPAATITASGPTTFCTGGSVTLTASAGASYLWSNGATTQSVTVSDSGNYSVTVTNAAGCSTTSAATAVTVNDNPVATITADGPTSFCTGGAVTLTASPGTSYLWSNGATTQSITVSASGNYSVTVTNAAGCSTTSVATEVSVNDNPAATITASGPTTFCTGGSVTLTASAGASYLWSNGATTQSVTVTDSGNYSVTVTNAAGCSTTSAATAVTVNDNPVATITADGPTSFCTGGAVTLTASAGTSYGWSNGATTQSITVSASGDYSVTVTNAAGCSTTSAATAVTVNDNPVATITASGPTSFCTGGAVTLTASAGASYLWSTGATTQSITVSDSGNYSVTVTNANGCSTTSAPVNVTENTPTAITAQPASITMPRHTTRQLTVGATGTETLQYQWYRGFSGDTSDPVTSGGNGSTLTVGPYNKKGTYRFWVRVTSSTCTGSTVNSNTASVTVN